MFLENKMSNAYFKTQKASTNVRFNMLRQASVRSLLGLAWFWAPGMTQRLLQRFFSTPLAYNTSAAEAACLDRGVPFQVPVNGNQVKAWKWGRGPGVLMLHGWNGRGIQFQAFVEPLVAAGYTAIAPDGPAHGESGGRYTNYFDFSDTARTFLAPGLGLDIRAVVGHSFGAAALINALAKDRHDVPAFFISPVLRLRELFVGAARQFGVSAKITEQMIEAFEAQYGYSLTDDNPIRLLEQLSVPILIAHDTDDHTISINDSMQQAQAYDTVDLLATRGLGHRRILSDPAVIQAGIDHIQSHRSMNEHRKTA
jgi:pimeloyl-ACP methyl ester carboxylesterase